MRLGQSCTALTNSLAKLWEKHRAFAELRPQPEAQAWTTPFAQGKSPSRLFPMNHKNVMHHTLAWFQLVETPDGTSRREQHLAGTLYNLQRLLVCVVEI